MSDPMFLGFWYHGFRLGELAGLLPDESTWMRLSHTLI